MQIIRYRDLSDVADVSNIKSGKALYELFDDSKDLIFLVNGIKVSPDYIPTESDVVMVRKVPGVTSTFLLVTAIIIGAAALGTAIYAGVKSYQARQEANKLKKQMETMNDSVENLPYLRGSQNSLAINKTQPYIIGEHILTPYLTQKDFYRITGPYGERLLVYKSFECGFAQQVLRQISIDDVIVKDFGTRETIPQTWWGPFDQGIYFEQANRIYISNDGSDFADPNFNVVTKQTDSGARLEKSDSDTYQDLIFTLVCILFNGLRSYNSDGSTSTRSVTVIPSYSYDNGTTWSNFSFSQFGGKGTSTNITTQAFGAGYRITDATAIIDVSLTYSNFTRIFTLKVNNKIVWSSTKKIPDKFSIDVKNGDVITATMDGQAPQSQATITSTGNGNAKSNTFTYNRMEQMRFNAHFDFPFNSVANLDTPVLIKLACTTPAATNQVYDECSVLWIQNKIFKPIESRAAGNFVMETPIDTPEKMLSTRMCMVIEVTPSNQDKLNKINILTSGVARNYNGQIWTTNKTPTRNPAAWLVEILTSPTHKASQCDDAEIDFNSFTEFYTYCRLENLFYDAVVMSGDTKETLLEKILTVSNAVLYNNSFGKIAVAIDTVKPNALRIFNEQNLISLNWTRDNKRQTDGIKINFINRDADFTRDMYLVMRDGVTRTADSVLREITVEGVTTYNHVVKHARRLMAIETLRQKKITIDVGKEAVYYAPLEKVLLTHPALKIGLANGEIKTVTVSSANQITNVTLYEPVEYDASNTDGYGVIIYSVTPDKESVTNRRVTVDSTGYVLTFNPPIAVTSVTISPGDILSYGYLNAGQFDRISSPYIISGFEPNDDGYTLELIDYNEAIFNTGTIPPYLPNISNKQTITGEPGNLPLFTPDDVPRDTEPPSVPTISSSTVLSSGEIEVVFNQSTDNYGVFYYNVYRKIGTGQNKILYTITHNGSPTYSFRDELIKNGLSYSYQISAVDYFNNESDLSTPVTNASLITDRPTPPAALTVIADNPDYIRVEVTPPTFNTNDRLNAESYQIEINKGKGAGWEIVKAVSGTQYIYEFDRTVDGYPESTGLFQWQFRAYSRSVYGLLSSVPTYDYVDTSDYGTWIPAIPTINLLDAHELGIDIGFIQNKTNKHYGNYKYTVTTLYSGTVREISGKTWCYRRRAVVR